jgi:hypothetical protein
MWPVSVIGRRHLPNVVVSRRYALPYRVIDALVEYFSGFAESTEIPPVLWQQTLLAFAQHYKAEITAEQKVCPLDSDLRPTRDLSFDVCAIAARRRV